MQKQLLTLTSLEHKRHTNCNAGLISAAHFQATYTDEPLRTPAREATYFPPVKQLNLAHCEREETSIVPFLG